MIYDISIKNKRKSFSAYNVISTYIIYFTLFIDSFKSITYDSTSSAKKNHIYVKYNVVNDFVANCRLKNLLNISLLLFLFIPTNNIYQLKKSPLHYMNNISYYVIVILILEINFVN